MNSEQWNKFNRYFMPIWLVLCTVIQILFSIINPKPFQIIILGSWSIFLILFFYLMLLPGEKKLSKIEGELKALKYIREQLNNIPDKKKK